MSEVKKMKKWQRRALAIMDQNTLYSVDGREPIPGRRRRIHIVLEGYSISTAFCAMLQQEDPERFLACIGIPTLEELTQKVTEAHDRGWSGDSCLFVLLMPSTDYSPLEKAIDRLIPHWKPRNVWLFTPSPPELEKIRPDHWRMMYIDNPSGDLRDKPLLPGPLVRYFGKKEVPLSR